MVHKRLGSDMYMIKDVENCQLTQLPYDGVVEANRIRLWVTRNQQAVPIDELGNTEK